jgi:hypothetical protein
MSTSSLELDKSSRTDRSGTAITWLATILACGYSLWIGWSLYRSVSAFAEMYNSMGVVLPVMTRFVVASYRWLFPVFFVGAAIAMIVKQLFVRDKWINLSITFITALAVDLVGSGIVRALYRPMLDLMEKLSK